MDTYFIQLVWLRWYYVLYGAAIYQEPLLAFPKYYVSAPFVTSKMCDTFRIQTKNMHKTPIFQIILVQFSQSTDNSNNGIILCDCEADKINGDL